MSILKSYYSFINEAVSITLEHDINKLLLKIKEVLTAEDNYWIREIIDTSGRDDIETNKLQDEKEYTFLLSDDPKYFTMEILDSRDNRSKQKIKIGKSIKSIVPDIPNHILSNITSALISYVNNKKNKIKIDDDNIEKYYNYNKIAKDGTLAHSCMNDKDASFFDLYENNKNVSIAVLIDEDDVLLGRSLIWTTTNGNTIMDRIYYSTDDILYYFKLFAKENGFLYVATEIMGDEIVDLEESDFINYPYLDNFSYISFDSNQLSVSDVFDDTDRVAILNDTNGEYEHYKNLEMPFEEVYSIDAYRDSQIYYFVELSIDSDTYVQDFIDGEVDNYCSEREEFIDVYKDYIEHNFYDLHLDNVAEELTLDNFEEKLEEFSQKYVNEFEEIVQTVIEHQYADATFFDINEEMDIIPKDLLYSDIERNQARFIQNFIYRYCDLGRLNNNLKEMYEEDYEMYLRYRYLLGLD